MDRNDYYGGESTSLNLIQVSFENFWSHLSKKKKFFWSHILSLQFIIASLFFRRVFIDCFIIIIF